MVCKFISVLRHVSRCYLSLCSVFGDEHVELSALRQATDTDYGEQNAMGQKWYDTFPYIQLHLDLRKCWASMHRVRQILSSVLTPCSTSSIQDIISSFFFYLRCFHCQWLLWRCNHGVEKCVVLCTYALCV